MFDRQARGPLITLLTGLLLALVLGVLSANAASSDASRNDAAAPPATSAPPPPATSAPPPPATTAPTTALRAAYAGRVDGGAASIAIAVRDGGAIAYVCDGRRIEAWLLGTATNGKLNLSGEGNSTLTGTFDKDSAEGTVRAGGKNWTLDVPVAKKPSGLYRSTADIRNARVVTGWIVLSDGEQVGIANTDGALAPAPRLDVTDGSATVNGAKVTADAIDGTSRTGF
jgi:serine/threonine-protein kinase